MDEWGTERDPFCEERDRTEWADVEATESARLRTAGWGGWADEAGTPSEGGRLLALPRLATDPLQEDELEDVDRREARRERAPAVIWKSSCSERGDGPGTGGSGRDGGREGGGFAVEERIWGMKVGGTGNSLRRRGTGVLRVCFTEERVMVDERKRGEMDERCSVCVRLLRRAKKESKSWNLKVCD